MNVAIHLLPFSGIAFLWFIGVLRDCMGEQEDRFCATVFMGSGLLFLALLFAAGDSPPASSWGWSVRPSA